MKTKLTFEQLQDTYGYVELTTGQNGYPSNITRAIACDEFETFEKLQEFANDNNLEIIQIHQKNGWDFWESRGYMYEPFEISSEDFGDNYLSFSKMDEEEFLEEEVKTLLEDVEYFKKLEKIIEDKKEIWKNIEAMEDDEIIITQYDNNYCEVYKRHPMSFAEDTHTFSYALIEK